jgi:hypothetical protein
MKNGAIPTRPGHWSSLRVRDGHQRHHRKFAKKRGKVRQIQPAVSGRQRLTPERREQRKMQKVRMKMDYVKRFGAPRYPVQQDQMIW